MIISGLPKCFHIVWCKIVYVYHISTCMIAYPECIFVHHYITVWMKDPFFELDNIITVKEKRPLLAAVLELHYHVNVCILLMLKILVNSIDTLEIFFWISTTCMCIVLPAVVEKKSNYSCGWNYHLSRHVLLNIGLLKQQMLVIWPV